MSSYKELQERKIGGKPAHEVVSRRNDRIIKLFAHNGIDVRLIGDVEKPAIILNDSLVLSCWAKNFDLILNDGRGKRIQVIKLTEVITDDNDGDILKEYVKEDFHKKVYTVALNKVGFFLHGYGFKDRRKKTGRYPIFASVNPKIFYTEHKAIDVCSELALENYEAGVV